MKKNHRKVFSSVVVFLLMVCAPFSFFARIPMSVSLAYAQTQTSVCPAGFTYSTGVSANGQPACTTLPTGILATTCPAGSTLQQVAGSSDTSANVCVSSQAPTGTPPTNLSNCSTWYNTIVDPTCWARGAATMLGTGIIWLASWVLTVSGLLFDWAISQTVANFGSFVNQNVISAINTAWSAFRDISNIVIIGMFTFIAIMTILGSTDYGAKKMISRVLIVAVLINFSLLFTKIIIDVSDFTSAKFLTAAGGVVAQAGSQTSSGSGSPSGDIAGQFMQYAGVSSFGNTYTAISKIAQDQNNGGWIALTYGVVIGLLELVAAIVLLYGTFLLVSRALLMIFLMITSSIAFASYLVPSLSQNYGWSAWWSALLKNAVFAPLLSVLLWATLAVAAAFNVSQNNSAGSLGALIANPTATVDISALFGYIIVIGLLFASIRIASSFATQIGGFNLAQAIAASPITQGSRLGGFVGRRFGLGSWAYRREESRIGEAKKARDDAEAARKLGDLASARKFDKKAVSSLRSAGRYGKVADSKMNLMNTGAAKALTKAIGLSGAAAGETAKGAESAAATIKRRADEAAKLGSKIAPNDDEKRRIRDEAERNIETQREGQRATKEALKEAAEQNASILKEAVDQEKSTNSEHQIAQTAVKGSEDTRKDLVQRSDATIKDLTQQIAAEIGAGRDGAAQKAQLDQHNVERKNMLQEQDNRIKDARERLGRINQNIEAKSFKISTADGKVIETTLQDARARAAAAGKDLSEFNAQTNSVKKEAGKKAIDAFTESITKEIGRTQGTILERVAGAMTGDNERVAEAATKKFRSKNSSAAKFREVVQAVESDDAPKKAEEGAQH